MVGLILKSSSKVTLGLIIGHVLLLGKHGISNKTYNELRDFYAAYLYGAIILHKIENLNLQKIIDKTVYRIIE